VIKVSDYRAGTYLDLSMDDEKSLALAYLVKEKDAVGGNK
jgi:hypothetical protein